jgi:peptide/nickel transport system substrate-binding protein
MRKTKDGNIFKLWVAGVIVGLIIFPYAWVGTSLATEKPQYGGILTFAVGSEPPSYDAHRESTFAVIHPISPHYSLLLKFDPENYPKVVGDLAESWTISKDYKTYTFKIHRGVKFHDGSILTAKDVKASYDKIIFPASGLMSMRKAFYSVVEKVEAPDDYTVVFRLKHPSASFLGSLASPWNYIYKADILAKDPRWYEKNIMGTGPFKFVEHVAGSHWVGKRNEDYFIKGRPYLDGYRATFIQDTATRVAAIRSGRVHAEFRYLSPTQRDDVVRALGDKIRVQESPLLSTYLVIVNCEKKPFNDQRVRRALTMALDRWEGSRVLSQISSMKEVGGLLRPGSGFSMNEVEITQVAGFSKDIEASRKEARRLLREAGVPEGFSFELKNRPPAKDFETTAIWLIDQWRQIGLNVTQKLRELGDHYKDLSSGNFEVILNAISDYMDEPDLQFIGFLSADRSPRNFGRYKDQILDDLYEKQSRAMDFGERKKLCHQFEKRVLDEMAYVYPVPWFTRIVLHSPKMKGWRILPSHFLNQDLATVWLEKD